MGSFSGKGCLPCKPYGYANFEHNRGGARFGALSFNTMILQHYADRSSSLRRLKEPSAMADRYIDGRGMSFGLEDQKPQLKPPSSPLGLFFSFRLAGSSLLPSQSGSSHHVQNENAQNAGKIHCQAHRRDYGSHRCFAGALAPSRRDSTRIAAKSRGPRPLQARYRGGRVIGLRHSPKVQRACSWCSRIRIGAAA
jgi:hypothetical protein